MHWFFFFLWTFLKHLALLLLTWLGFIFNRFMFMPLCNVSWNRLGYSVFVMSILDKACSSTRTFWRQIVALLRKNLEGSWCILFYFAAIISSGLLNRLKQIFQLCFILLTVLRQRCPSSELLSIFIVCALYFDTQTRCFVLHFCLPTFSLVLTASLTKCSRCFFCVMFF